MFTTARTEIPSIKIDPITAKKVAPPILRSLYTLTCAHPLASAKSAIDHIKKNSACEKANT